MFGQYSRSHSKSNERKPHDTSDRTAHQREDSSSRRELSSDSMTESATNESPFLPNTSQISRPDESVAMHVAHLMHLYDTRQQELEARQNSDSLGLGNLLISSRVDERVYLKHIVYINSGLRRVRVDGALLQSAWNCIEELLGHRQVEARNIAYDYIDVCMELHHDRVPMAMKTSIFYDLARGKGHGDFLRRQKCMRLLLQDGRYVAPFAGDIGWFLLKFLETSDAQKELSSLLHCILRRSSQVLDLTTISSIATLLSSRCDAAYSRGEKDPCKRFLKFITILVTHKLDAAASNPNCLRTMCALVNVKEDGVNTWTIMRHLLSGTSGYQVLRGLMELLEADSSPYVLRGAVFFVGMSSWGSQRIASLELGWAAILLSLLPVVESRHGVVIFEVVLSIQRLIKKYRDQMQFEWDLIFQFFKRLLPWMQARPQNFSGDMQHHDIQPERLPSELLDTLLLIDELVDNNRLQGDLNEYFKVVELYMSFCPFNMVVRLMDYRAAACHPTSDSTWHVALEEFMATFYSSQNVNVSIRLKAIELLGDIVWFCLYTFEYRVIDEILLPTLQYVYDDDDVQVRCAGLGLIIQIAVEVESQRFHALVDVLHHAVTDSKYSDAIHEAMNGLVSLFNSCFSHIPATRSVRLFELLVGYCSNHRDVHVRHTATNSLMHVCTANDSYQMILTSSETPRASPFLVSSRQDAKGTTVALPISKLVVALLTMASTETNADTFQLAVNVLFCMIENRYVLHDIDINDMTSKLISCIECRAFGRAATTHATAQHKPKRTRSMTDSQLQEETIPEETSWNKVVLTQYLQRGYEMLLLLATHQENLASSIQTRVVNVFVSGLDMHPTPFPSTGGMKRANSEKLLYGFSPEVAALHAAENALVHTLTRGIITLALIMVDEMQSEIPTITRSITQKLCRPHHEGEWLVEITCMGLSFLWNLLHCVSVPEMELSLIVDFAVDALVLPASKYMSSLALHTIMSCLTLSSPSHRVTIAQAALPRLYAIPTKAMIVETTIDFIQTRVYEESTPSTKTTPSSPESMSWLDKNSIITIDTIAQQSQVTIRRATKSHTWTIPQTNEESMNPVHIMTLLYGIDPILMSSAKNIQKLVAGPSLQRALNVLDRSPEYETHKIGVLYITHATETEKDLLDVIGGSPRYSRFLRGLGKLVPLQQLHGYNGGLDVSPDTIDGEYGLLYKDPSIHVMFHVATLMYKELAHIKQIQDEEKERNRHNKKRHIGNDYVHIVYIDYNNGQENTPTLSGHFNDVHILVQPLDSDGLLYRTQVKCKSSLPSFGPLHGMQLIPSTMIATAVRLTAINANIACRIVHQDHFEYILNAEDRLRQIQHIGQRLCT